MNIFRLATLLKLEKPDVVQTWMYHADLIGGVISRLVGIRNIFWGVRHSLLDKESTKRKTIFIAYLCAYLSKSVPKKIICCANKALESHVEIGYERSKMKTIRNGYDLTKFFPDLSKRKFIRAALEIDESTLLIGSVGRFDKNKDHKNLLLALELLGNRGIPFLCVLVGADMSSDNPELNELIGALKLENKVQLLGQRDDIPWIMNAFDNRPVWFRLLWQASNILRIAISALPHKLRYFVSQLIAGLIYWPLARFASTCEKFGASENFIDNFPLSSYRSLSFYTMRTDALDRFGTRLEQRFTKSQIKNMMESSGLEDVVFSNESIYWLAVGYKESE